MVPFLVYSRSNSISIQFTVTGSGSPNFKGWKASYSKRPSKNLNEFYRECISFDLIHFHNFCYLMFINSGRGVQFGSGHGSGDFQLSRLPFSYGQLSELRMDISRSPRLRDTVQLYGIQHLNRQIWVDDQSICGLDESTIRDFQNSISIEVWYFKKNDVFY